MIEQFVREGWVHVPGAFTTAAAARCRAPGDDGWHVESSFTGPDGGPRLSVDSRGRSLLMLFLYPDVGPDDAPTLLRSGSHRDVAPLLAPHGAAGADWLPFCGEAVPATARRPEVAACGRAGDVYLVHPFVVHRAQAMSPAARRPRVIAQPPLGPASQPAFDLPAGTAPAERVVREALG